MLRRKKNSVMNYNQSTEEVRILRSNIEKQLEDSHSQIVMITSPKGPSHHIYISSQLAISFAEQGKKVLLVDANLRNPTLHTYFNISNTKGFSDVVMHGENGFLHAQNDYIRGLSILTAGNLYETPVDLWVSKKIEHVVNNWKQRFDFVLFHAPSYLEISDAQVLVDQCDGVLLVVQSGKTKIEDAVAAKKQINHSKKPILGVIYQTG